MVLLMLKNRVPDVLQLAEPKLLVGSVIVADNAEYLLTRCMTTWHTCVRRASTKATMKLSVKMA